MRLVIRALKLLLFCHWPHTTECNRYIIEWFVRCNPSSFKADSELYEYAPIICHLSRADSDLYGYAPVISHPSRVDNDSCGYAPVICHLSKADFNCMAVSPNIVTLQGLIVICMAVSYNLYLSKPVWGCVSLSQRLSEPPLLYHSCLISVVKQSEGNHISTCYILNCAMIIRLVTSRNSELCEGDFLWMSELFVCGRKQWTSKASGPLHPWVYLC